MERKSTEMNVSIAKALTSNYVMMGGVFGGIIVFICGVLLPFFTVYFLESLYLIILGLAIVLSCLHYALIKADPTRELAVSRRIVIPILIIMMLSMWLAVGNLQAGVFSAFCCGTVIKFSNMIIRKLTTDRPIGTSFSLLFAAAILSILTIFFPFLIMVFPMSISFSAMENNVYGMLGGIALSTIIIFSATGATNMYLKRNPNEPIFKKAIKKAIIGSIALIIVLVLLLLGTFAGIGTIYIDISFYLGVAIVILIVLAGFFDKSEVNIKALSET